MTPSKNRPEAELENTEPLPDGGEDAGSLADQLQQALSERNDYYDQMLRAQAELENYRRRTQNELDQMRRYQSLGLARDLLPGLDNLQRAVKAAEVSPNAEELLQGVQMVAAQFEEILSRHSVTPISALGEPFDPNRHEAVQQIPSGDHPPMTIVEEIERGYELHDRVVRPSKVIVSSRPADAHPIEPTHGPS